MTSNSVNIVEREIANGTIEGVDFGTRLWVIARSPSAVLVWVYGYSASINGNRSYYQPHLTILPDRSPRFINNPAYKSLRADWTRLTPVTLNHFATQICETFGSEFWQAIVEAVAKKRTAVIEGGGGQLHPYGLYGVSHRDWHRNRENGFIVLPTGMTRHESYRHKMGWKPEDA